jgi:hypothetical protein
MSPRFAVTGLTRCPVATPLCYAQSTARRVWQDTSAAEQSTGGAPLRACRVPSKRWNTESPG